MQLQDHFLIAMPDIEDSYFYRSVIYICEHNEKGSMGLVLTQPTDLSIAELMVKFNFMMANSLNYPSDYVLAGGPVNLERGFILHTDNGLTYQNSHKVSDHLCLTTSADIIKTFGTDMAPENYLVTLGCARWGEGQLGQEIAENSWLVIPANEHILFEVPCENRWLSANQLLGIHSHNFSYHAGHC
ncbi:MAG: YqgE/AlgH family protein [Pasteurellaceae bacterium]|nr:YqgE/AlgH family protein [Pasteurellaceae bacterium]